MRVTQMDVDALPRRDAALVRSMAEDAGVSPEAIMRQIVREYLSMVRNVPEVLPNNPMTRLTANKVKRR